MGKKRKSVKRDKKIEIGTFLESLKGIPYVVAGPASWMLTGMKDGKRLEVEERLWLIPFILYQLNRAVGLYLDIILGLSKENASFGVSINSSLLSLQNQEVLQHIVEILLSEDTDKKTKGLLDSLESCWFGIASPLEEFTLEELALPLPLIVTLEELGVVLWHYGVPPHNTAIAGLRRYASLMARMIKCTLPLLSRMEIRMLKEEFKGKNSRVVILNGIEPQEISGEALGDWEEWEEVLKEHRRAVKLKGERVLPVPSWFFAGNTSPFLPEISDTLEFDDEEMLYLGMKNVRSTWTELNDSNPLVWVLLQTRSYITRANMLLVTHKVKNSLALLLTTRETLESLYEEEEEEGIPLEIVEQFSRFYLLFALGTKEADIEGSEELFVLHRDILNELLNMDFDTYLPLLAESEFYRLKYFEGLTHNLKYDLKAIVEHLESSFEDHPVISKDFLVTVKEMLSRKEYLEAAELLQDFLYSEEWSGRKRSDDNDQEESVSD